MKHPWQSKTLWVNLIIIVLALFGVSGLDEFVPLHPNANENEWIIVIIALVNGVLRLVTHERIELK